MAANEGKSEPAIPAFAKLLHIEVDPSTPNRVSARSCRRLLSIIRPLALTLKVKRLETHFMTKTKISLGRIADDAPDAKTPSAVAGTDGAQTEQARMPVRLRRVFWPQCRGWQADIHLGDSKKISRVHARARLGCPGCGLLTISIAATARPIADSGGADCALPFPETHSAPIQWNTSKEAFEIRCLGRNGLTVRFRQSARLCAETADPDATRIYHQWV